MLARGAEKTSEGEPGLVGRINKRAITEAVRKDRGRESSVSGRGAKFACAGVAGTDLTEMIEAKNAGGVTVCKLNLHGVVADSGGGPGGDFRLKHRQSLCAEGWS